MHIQYLLLYTAWARLARPLVAQLAGSLVGGGATPGQPTPSRLLRRQMSKNAYKKRRARRRVGAIGRDQALISVILWRRIHETSRTATFNIHDGWVSL
jgi:hypothetical protein